MRLNWRAKQKLKRWVLITVREYNHFTIEGRRPLVLVE